MEKTCNGQESESVSAAIFHVIGEPAIGINGLPNMTPVVTAPIQLDAASEAKSKDEPCFGEWLEGREVQKMFGDQYYYGKVVKFDRESNWYRVVYEDGDFEDLEWHELEDLILPLDISISLKALALQICKCDISIGESGRNADKSRKWHTRNFKSVEKAGGLVENAQVSDLESESTMREKVHCGRMGQESVKRHRETQMPSRDVHVVVKKELPQDIQISDSKNAQVGDFESEREIERKVHCGRMGQESVKRHRGTQMMSKNVDSVEKTRELLQGTLVSDSKTKMLMLANLHCGSTAQDTSKRQRKIQAQSRKTAQAEKQKKRENIGAEGTLS